MIDATDLYEILGVPRNADVAAISKAYRSKIFALHPDRGGDPDDFHVVQEAFDTLSDQTKRAYYDSCGLIDGSEAAIEAKAEVALADVTVSIFGNSFHVDSDLFGVIRQWLAASISVIEADKSRHQDMASRFFTAAKRVRRSGDGKNIIAERLIARATEHRKEAQRAATTIAVNRKAIEIARSYYYEGGVSLPSPGIVFSNFVYRS